MSVVAVLDEKKPSCLRPSGTPGAENQQSQNNLTLLRLIAAGLVVFGHAFTFVGKQSPDILGLSPGALGVYIFFSVSGFLITQSFDRDPHLLRFLARRSLRIFPALAVCILVTVFILGPLFSSLGWRAYFQSPDTWGYMRNLGLYIVYSLPGVFAGNAFPHAVNGSLWTLPVEFGMYLILAACGLVSRKRSFFALLALIWAVTSLFWARPADSMLVFYGTDIRQLFICGTYFWIGANIYSSGWNKYFGVKLAIAAILLHLIAAPCDWLRYIVDWFAIAIIALSFGLSRQIPPLGKLIKDRDYSYGVYIYAFPIQQAIACLCPQIEIAPYLVLSATVIFFCAFLSWHLIEKPCLSLKPRAISAS
ncbi:MAG TPA: acyltransferase [Candidatus Melainabacteria bacterium]|nr:acyltransferase [Candidatus Melainabacteria bacterium]